MVLYPVKIIFVYNSPLPFRLKRKQGIPPPSSLSSSSQSYLHCTTEFCLIQHGLNTRKIFKFQNKVC